MTIIVSSIRRPGVEYTSDKLAQLGNYIAGGVRKRSNGNYYARVKLDGKSLRVNLFKQADNGSSKPASKDEQGIWAGRISDFLMRNGLSSNVRVV